MNSYLKKFIESKFNTKGTALDLGAGEFFDVACLKQMGWNCEGVDKKTGVDLEFPYKSDSNNAPFDLVFSNYVLQKIKNKKQFIKTAYDNLKSGGWLFIHTFDKSDENSSSDLTKESITDLLKAENFKNISAEILDFYDNDEGHKHWHKILEVTAQKP